MQAFQEILSRQQIYFDTQLRGSTWRQRVKKLRSIKRYIFQNRQLLTDAVYKDLRKHPVEMEMTEILPLLGELNYAIRNLDLWMIRKKATTQLHLLGSKAWIEFDPKGVVLIVSPWNYPFLLTLGPVISAIASGNCVVLKPSEHTPATTACIAKMIQELFSPDEITVVEGGPAESDALLKLRFDHIFFTGSIEVGKIVSRNAAENLVPVTLELGGCNPAIVDETANVHDAAQKIIWGKLINNGQSCVAPNYVLVHQSKFSQLVSEMKSVLDTFYGKDGAERKKSPHLTRMVNLRHFQRVKEVMDKAISEGAKIETGGETDEDEKYIAPTLLTNVNPGFSILEDEIFGPLLPVLPYNSIEEALRIVKSKEHALALYIFSKSRKKMNAIKGRISSGTVVFNETKIQFANPSLPFGGVGMSGSGKGHGHYGFLELSNERAVLHQRRGITTVKMFYPPYSSLKQKLLRLISRIF